MPGTASGGETPRSPLIAPTYAERSGSGVLRFEDIDAACGDLAEQRSFLCLLNRGHERAASGRRMVITDLDAAFRVSTLYQRGVTIDVEGDERFSLDFGPPPGRTLQQAYYPRATRFPFNKGPNAGLDFTQGSRGCNTEEGQFQVRRLSIRGDRVLRFEADFETDCNDALGRIVYRSGDDGGLKRDPKSGRPVISNR